MGDAGGGRADDDPSRWSQFRGVRHELREVMMAKPFKGTINVGAFAIDVSGEPYHDLEREAALMLMRE
jgi:hypothetical protein